MYCLTGCGIFALVEIPVSCGAALCAVSAHHRGTAADTYFRRNIENEEDHVIPLEVKAETNVKAKSLRQFVLENNPALAYRISMNDYQVDTWLVNLPLYAVNTL